MQLGLVGVVLITIAVVAMIGLVVLVLRVTVFGGQRDYFRQRSPLLDDEPMDGGRIDIVETREIDGRRKLVLVRCDDVEHLIVVGGPADLVVENDVRKARTQSSTPRAPAPPPAQTPQPAAAKQQVSPAVGASLDAAVAAAVPRNAETPRPAAPAPRAPLPQRNTVTAVAARPTGRNGEAPRPVAPAAKAGPTRVTIQHPPSGDQQRRAAPAAHIRVSPQPALAVAPAPPPRPQPERQPQMRAEKQPRTENQARAERTNNVRNGGAPVGLPQAQVPWAESDTIEADIVQALRLDGPRRAETAEPQSAEAVQPAREAEPAKPVESSATLGDLADRLEEALAREMQSVGPNGPKRAEASAAAATAPEKGTDNASAKRLVARDKPEKKPEPAQQPTVSAAPEPPQPAAPRETAQNERREEAPVISLSARRREVSDPLEDEMARLLGELTGDKGR